MALNPIACTEPVVRSFLRYQFTAYAIADPHLQAHMRESLVTRRARQSPLLARGHAQRRAPTTSGRPRRHAD